MGDDFPKLIYHSIVCIGALVATRTDEGYKVLALGASHIGQRTERDLIGSFVQTIEQLERFPPDVNQFISGDSLAAANRDSVGYHWRRG